MVKNLPDSAGDMGSIPGWEESSWRNERLHYSRLENPKDRGAW